MLTRMTDEDQAAVLAASRRGALRGDKAGDDLRFSGSAALHLAGVACEFGSGTRSGAVLARARGLRPLVRRPASWHKAEERERPSSCPLSVRQRIKLPGRPFRPARHD
jgi:hypothetical protein